MKFTPIACSFEIKPFNGRIQLFPYGRFFPQDGRPEGQGAGMLTTVMAMT